jgi:hypothetical protein
VRVDKGVLLPQNVTEAADKGDAALHQEGDLPQAAED